MDQSNVYQCNSYKCDNVGYLTEMHLPFYDFPSEETSSSNITIFEGSFSNKENIPVNNQVDLAYRNENDNQLLIGSQGQVHSPFLGFENTCSQFSQPPELSPYLSYENNQVFYSQPPVLSPCPGYSETFTTVQTVSLIESEAIHSDIDYLKQQNVNEEINFVSESELVSKIRDNSESNSNINILNTSDNCILLQTPTKQVPENLNYDLNLSLNPQRKDENLVALRYLNDSETTNISYVFETQVLENENNPENTSFLSENKTLECKLVPNICDNSSKNILDTSDNHIVLQTPIKQVPENLNYDLILPLHPQRKDENLSVLKYLNDSSESINILKTPIKTTTQQTTNKFISPVKSILKSSALKKSISFHPSTSVISNTGEETPSKYNESFSKNISSDFSPEMFSDDDENDSCLLKKYAPSEVEIDISKISTMNTCNKQDRLLLKRLQESFIGILPPPSVTICQLNAEDILNKYNQNKEMYSVQKICENNELECLKSNKKSSMLINCDLSSAMDFNFPDIMIRRYHGLHYNRSKLSEDIEHLCQKYSERFIGCETSSSCTIWQQNVSSSASKRRMIRKQQLCKSPGRRLSHLARRRITFSKENLNAKNSVLPSITMSNNQRMIGVKKNDILIKKRLSPNKKILSPRKRIMISPRKRKTPSKSPRKYITRTPTSSAKKRRRTTPSNETTTSTSFTLNNRTLSSKRALFQSPDSKSAASSSTSSNIKRKLFAKSDNTPEDIACNRKRKRDLDDDDVTPQREKFLRSFSSNDIAMDKTRSNFSRRNSETVTSSSADFSEHHTKKMLWAISTALRTQNIGMSHPNFKTYASVLSQICKRLLSDLLPGQTRLPGSVNERMSKIAHQHVYAVVKGKTVDEIINDVKTKSILLTQKPKGYIAPDNFNLDNNRKSTTSMLTTAAVETTENINNLVINDNKKLDKSRIRRQIMFDKLV